MKNPNVVVILAVIAVATMWLIIGGFVPLPIWSAFVAPAVFVTYTSILMLLDLRDKKKRYSEILKKYDMLNKENKNEKSISSK